MRLRDNGTMGQWDNGTMGQWDNGTMGKTENFSVISNKRAPKWGSLLFHAVDCGLSHQI